MCALTSVSMEIFTIRKCEEKHTRPRPQQRVRQRCRRSRNPHQVRKRMPKQGRCATATYLEERLPVSLIHSGVLTVHICDRLQFAMLEFGELFFQRLDPGAQFLGHDRVFLVNKRRRPRQ
jgi:hypothetical protein